MAGSREGRQPSTFGKGQGEGWSTEGLMPSFLFLRAAIHSVLSSQVRAIPSLGKRRATQLGILEERSVVFRKPGQVLEKNKTKQN